jgi:flagellar motor protein MotB
LTISSSSQINRCAEAPNERKRHARFQAGNLVTVGYGATQLKDPANPLAAENRRVQVINAADK